ncbi:MAG: hypothetical protein M1819_004847 [Sarea resinae]|nr:MAG: hypothetical protein M1819_004847 [Sarea resinae]
MSDATVFSSKLHSSHIFIIGGTSGVGLGVAAGSLEAHAARVTISSSSDARLESALAHLKSLYPSRASTVTGYTCDLSAPEGLETRIKGLLDTVTEGGQTKIDHIVFTAGNPLHLRPLHEVSYEEIVAAGTVRFFAPLLLAKNAFYGAYMASAASASSITLTSGSASQKPPPGWTIPASYAAALRSVTRTLALDLKPVRVNIVSPGPMDTALWDAHGTTKEEIEAAKKSFGAQTVTGTLGRVEDVAECYLTSMRDKNMTGTCLNSNGVLAHLGGQA